MKASKLSVGNAVAGETEMTKIGEVAQQLSNSPAGVGVLVTRLDEARAGEEPDVLPTQRIGADQPDPYLQLNIPELYLG